MTGSGTGDGGTTGTPPVTSAWATNATSTTVTISATGTGSGQTWNVVPGVSVTRLYATEETVNQLVRGLWPQGNFHIRQDCSYLKGKNWAAIDGGVMQNLQRSSNWMLIIGGEQMGRICSRCARRLLSNPDDQRHLRAEMAKRAVKSAKDNP
tara:strand:+ start:4106 stop:4561 length:456 start_codon:yes stop_codon:yes gene_type:complete